MRQCAALAKAACPRRTIVRAHLGDRSVYLALLRRLSLDVASALLVGLLCGNASHALWLGAAAALLSASLAATPISTTKRFRHSVAALPNPPECACRHFSCAREARSSRVTQKSLPSLCPCA